MTGPGSESNDPEDILEAEETGESDIDPDDDARRGEPLVTETAGGTRIWATGWYRVRPGTFVHHELFFDSERVICLYAEESHKSYLLRRSGREREAARVGRKHLDRPASDMRDHSRSFEIAVTDIEAVELRSGSLLFKPKLTIRSTEHTYEFYHWRRGQDTAALAETLRTRYGFDVVEK